MSDSAVKRRSSLVTLLAMAAAIGAPLDMGGKQSREPQPSTDADQAAIDAAERKRERKRAKRLAKARGE